ncbi:alpha/beta hydrolase [soil metagenome]
MDSFRVGDGANIAFRQVKGDAHTLVFVHGAYIASSEWEPQIAALGDKSHVLVDLRGHGRSERKGQPYSVTQFADDVAQLIRHLGLKDVILCGHSLGGMVAQQLAVVRPELVSKVVLVDTSYSVRSTRLESFPTYETLPLFNLAPVSWQTELFASQIGKHSAGAKRYVKAEIGKHAEDPANYRAVWKAVTQFSGYEQLSKIRCPTLIMVGELNKQTHRQAQVMNRRIHNSELVFVQNAGHMLNWDNPERFNRALLGFTEQ